ncbi:DUF6906 family protein [Heyndrickxia coagulans]
MKHGKRPTKAEKIILKGGGEFESE